MTRVLIVGDLNGHTNQTARMVKEAGLEVAQTNSIDGALRELRDGRAVDCAMVDVSLRIEKLLSEMEKGKFNTEIIACGSSEMVPSHIIALNKHYLRLPIVEKNLQEVLANTLSQTKAEHPFISADEKTLEIIKKVKQFANSNASVLISGESGTGKEVLAKTIHLLSGLPKNKFYAFNCAAIPDNLLESELFGYEKGAFTGALNRKIGKFEEASGGTLLLDEISEMDLRLQAKLLRVIQEQEVDRLGGVKPIKIHVRIIATSNRNMNEYMKQGKFREDLYYRLNVIHIELPPLRSRKKDIIILAEHFIKKFQQQYQRKNIRLSNAALEKLQQHDFPGNVRELENTIHRAVVMTNDDVITDQHVQLLLRE